MSDKQGCEWLRLYKRIKTALKQHGKADYVTKDGLQVADYYLVQDNWGGPLHQVEIHSLHLLEPAVIKSLQGLLRDFLNGRLLSASTFREWKTPRPVWD